MRESEPGLTLSALVGMQGLRSSMSGELAGRGRPCHALLALLRHTDRNLEKPRGIQDATLDVAGNVRCVTVTPDGKLAVSGAEDKTLRVWDLEAGTLTATLTGHRDAVTCASLTPDGKRAVSGSADKTLRLWDLETGTCAATLTGHKGAVSCLALAPKRMWAVSGSWDRTLKLWDLEAGTCTATLPRCESLISFAAMTPDGKHAIAGLGDGALKVLDLEAGTCAGALPGHQGEVSCVALAADGRRAFSGSHDKTLKVWDMEAGSCTATFPGHAQVSCVALALDGRRGVSGSDFWSLKVWDLEAGTCTGSLPGHKGEVSCVALTPDGKRAVSGSCDQTLKLWDLEAGTCTADLPGHKNAVSCVALTADGKRAVSGSRLWTVKGWDLEAGTCTVTLLGHKGEVYCVALTPDGRRAVSGSHDKTLEVWDLEAATCTATLSGHEDCVCCVALTPDGKQAVSGSWDGSLELWDLKTGNCTAALPGHEELVCCVALTPDGKRAMSRSEDETLKVWDLEAGTCTATVPSNEKEVSCVALTPNGKRAVSGSEDGTLKVWDLDTGTCNASLPGHEGPISCVVVTLDGRRAVSGSWDQTLKVWDLEAGTCTATIPSHEQAVCCVALTPDGRRAISGSEDTLKMWDLEAGSCTATLPGHENGVSCLALTPDGNRAFSGSHDKTLKVWDMETSTCTATLPGRGAVSCVALTPDGRRAVSGSGFGVHVWDVEAGTCTTTLPESWDSLAGHGGLVTCVALTDDGKLAVSGSHDKTLKVWDLEAGTCTATLTGHKGEVSCVALTPYGRRAVSGSGDNTLQMWDLEAGTCTATLSDHEGDVCCVALTPDGKRAISGSGDDTLKVWDLEAGICTGTLPGHKGAVSCVAVTPGGKQAVSGSHDSTVKLWDLEAGTCTATLSGHKGKVCCVALTPDGKRAVSGSDDSTLKAWDLAAGGDVDSDLKAHMEASFPGLPHGGNAAGRQIDYAATDISTKSEKISGPDDAAAIVLNAENPVQRLRIRDDIEIELAVHLKHKTLAVTLVPPVPTADSDAEPPASDKVVFFIPVTGQLEEVTAQPVRFQGREPEVAVTSLFVQSDLDLGGDLGSVYRLRWLSWLSDLPRGRVDMSHALPPPDIGRLHYGFGGPRLGCYLSYMHHLAGAGAVNRQELYHTHGAHGFLAAVRQWPVQRGALRIRDLLGRTPLEVLLSDEAPRPEDLSDLLEAYLHDASECARCGDLKALDCNLECQVRCLPRIRQLNMAAETVWKALDLYGFRPTGVEAVGISAVQHLSPVPRRFWRPQLSTLVVEDVHVPFSNKRDGERYDLWRCSVPNLFDAVPTGVFLRLLPSCYRGEGSKAEDMAAPLPSTHVPWTTIIALMPKPFFAMPLARAAIEHRRPYGILAASFGVHLLVTVLFGVLLTWRPHGKALWGVLWALTVLSLVVLFDEALQLANDYSSTEATLSWVRRLWGAVSKYLDFYNVVDLVLCLSPPVLLLVLLLAGEDSAAYLIVFALGVLSCSLKYLNFMRAVPFFAPIVAMMERIIVRTRPDMALLVVLTVGFAAANHTLLHASRYYDLRFWQMLLRHLIRYTLGDTSIFEYSSETEIVEGFLEVEAGRYLDASHVLDNELLFALFTLVNVGYAYLTVVIFFNLLIARMASIYEEVEERQLSSLTFSCAVIYEEYRCKWRLARCLLGFGTSAVEEVTTQRRFLYRWHPVAEQPWQPSNRAVPDTGTRPMFKAFHMVEDVESDTKAQGRQLAEQGKQQAEQARQLAEQAKLLAEQGRQLADLKKQQAEILRHLLDLTKRS